MKVKCRILSFETPASDKSRVPYEVISSYINSQACKEDIANRIMLGTLTHRSRAIQAVFPDNPTLSKTVGKDDSMLIVDDKAPTPTHYVSDLWLEKDGWLWGTLTILDTEGLDDRAVQNIKRLRGLLKQGIKLTISCVLLGYWKSTNGGDELSKLQSLKSCDFTMNPSWGKKAAVVDIINEEGDYESEGERSYSDLEDGKMYVKTFSATDSVCAGYPKSSKINNEFTTLKAKCFSTCAEVTDIVEEESVPVQKEYSIASVKERLREAKYSPRVFFRKTILSYKQVVKSLGDRMDEETKGILKGMFTNDILFVIQRISPQVIQGKSLMALLGAGALGKNVRQAAQKLQIPYRFAFNELTKQGFVSKNRYQKLQTAYMEFINSLCDEVFNNPHAPVVEEGDESEQNNEETEG